MLRRTGNAFHVTPFCTGRTACGFRGDSVRLKSDCPGAEQSAVATLWRQAILPGPERNEVAQKVLRSMYRMMDSERLFYADFHPGNFLVMNDGRLGVIDFSNEADFRRGVDHFTELVRKR